MGEASGPRRGIVEAAVLALLGGLILWDARGYPAPLSPGVPGPALFPRLVAGFLIGGAVWLGVRRRSPPERFGGGLRLGGAFAGIAVFLLASPVFGAAWCLAPLACWLMWLAGERSPGILAAVPLGFAAFAHLLFAAALGVPLP